MTYLYDDRTSAAGFALEHYQGQQDNEVSYIGEHEGDYNTSMNYNNSASQHEFTNQPFGGGDVYREDRTTALHGQHNLNEFSDACNGNDVLVDGNRRFYNEGNG